MSTTPTIAPHRVPTRRRVPTWRVPLALVALSLIPVIAGSVRLTDLSTGSTYMPRDAHHPDMPVALIVHIVTATVYSLLGAFQFSEGVRLRHPRWHRAAGRVLVPMGLAVALSALWLTLVYPTEANTGPVLFWSRLLVALAMVACLVLGLRAVLARRFRTHRAWMVRAYALGLGAGTQVVTIGIAEATLGTSTAVIDTATAAGWAVNLAVAELIVRRPSRRRSRRSS
ncbi:DUF2306 domain-containing protein [Nocardioides sp.]|uniref:DUF2306 domain-containing protein n=1 Tax=Nocardioides sp. TaxID=35761 RepID=UPI0035B3C9AC